MNVNNLVVEKGRVITACRIRMRYGSILSDAIVRAHERRSKKICIQHFRNVSGLTDAKLSEGSQATIYAITTPYIMLHERFREVDQSNPDNGNILKLIDRAYETAIGALTLTVLNQIREAEVLARTLYESSATCHYIVTKKPSERLVNYFRNYVATERKQNQKWLNDLGNETGQWQNEHRQRIRDKEVALKGYEKFIDGHVEHQNLSVGTSSFPNLFERVSETSHKVNYRTVYAAMCSQTHHDAEDILNFYIALSLSGNNYEDLENEANCFGIYIILTAMVEFVDALKAIGLHFQFSTIQEEAEKSKKSLLLETSKVAPLIEQFLFPDNWRV